MIEESWAITRETGKLSGTYDRCYHQPPRSPWKFAVLTNSQTTKTEALSIEVWMIQPIAYLVSDACVAKYMYLLYLTVLVHILSQCTPSPSYCGVFTAPHRTYNNRQRHLSKRTPTTTGTHSPDFRRIRNNCFLAPLLEALRADLGNVITLRLPASVLEHWPSACPGDPPPWPIPTPERHGHVPRLDVCYICVIQAGVGVWFLNELFGALDTWQGKVAKRELTSCESKVEDGRDDPVSFRETGVES